MKLLTYGMLLLLPLIGSGQSSWGDITSRNLTYGEMLDECEEFFAETGTGRGSGYKQFLRWKTIMDARASRNSGLMNYQAINKRAHERARQRSPQVRSTAGTWENIGPFDQYGSDAWSSGGMGRVICSAFHPTNNSVIWVGTAAGGLWKTTNGGTTWSPLTDAFASIAISAIAVNYANPNILYILTGDGRASDAPSIGVLKTTDGGLTWQETDLTFVPSENKFGYRLVMHPTNPNVLFASINGNGLFKTSNGGSTFTQEINADTTIWDIEFIPGDPNQILLATNKGLIRSINGGVTWVLDNDPSFPGAYACMNIAVSPSQPQNVYVIFNGDTGMGGTFRGCFKSTDYGATFTMQSSAPNIFGWALDGGDNGDQGARDLAFIVDPANDARLFAGGVNIWKSEDSGATWGRETWWTHQYDPSDPFVHADQQNFYWLGTTIFTNNDGGIFKSSDYGNDWTDLSEGLAIGQFYEIDIHNNEYIGGLQDNGTMEGTFDNPQSHQILGADGFGCAWHTGDHSIKFLSTQASIIRRQFGSNIIIWDGIGNFAFWETEIEMHRTDPNYLFLDQDNKLYRGHQEFFIWNFIWEDLNTDAELSGDDIRGYSQSPSDPDVMYVVNLDGIIKTENLSAATPDWDVLPNPVTGDALLYDVVVHPSDPDKVWVVRAGYETGKKVYYSDNGGTSWSNISGSIENVPIRCIEYVSGSNSGLYIGTEIGVYYRGDGMPDWVPFANYLPNTLVLDLEIRDGYVYAGTHGRGIWRSPVYSHCPATINLTQGNDPGNPFSPGTQYHYASNSITSTRIIEGDLLDTEIYYISENKTDLLPGFIAKNGFFVAKVGDCPD